MPLIPPDSLMLPLAVCGQPRSGSPARLDTRPLTAYLFSNLRRKKVAKLFTNPFNTLQMRFPRQVLGTVYPSGQEQNRARTDDLRLTHHSAFNPVLIAGARLPHFWLKPMHNTEAARISSLDLPVIAAENRGTPVHVLLMPVLAPEHARRLIAALTPRFVPLDAIRISTDGGPVDEADYVVTDHPSIGRPWALAVVVRPDGHVVWVKDSVTAESRHCSQSSNADEQMPASPLLLRREMDHPGGL